MVTLPPSQPTHSAHSLSSSGRRRRSRLVILVSAGLVLVLIVAWLGHLLSSREEPGAFAVGMIQIPWVDVHPVAIGYALGSQGTPCPAGSDRQFCYDQVGGGHYLKFGSLGSGKVSSRPAAFAFANAALGPVDVLWVSCKSNLSLGVGLCKHLSITAHPNANRTCYPAAGSEYPPEPDLSMCRKLLDKGERGSLKWTLGPSDGKTTGFISGNLTFGNNGGRTQKAMFDRSADLVWESSDDGIGAVEGTGGTTHVWLELNLDWPPDQRPPASGTVNVDLFVNLG